MKKTPVKKSELRPGLLVASNDWTRTNIWTVAEVQGNLVYILGDGYESPDGYRPSHSSGWCDYSGFYRPTLEQIQNYLDEGRRIIDRKMAEDELSRVRRITGRGPNNEDLLKDEKVY
jgi:hypothetical protein